MSEDQQANERKESEERTEGLRRWTTRSPRRKLTRMITIKCNCNHDYCCSKIIVSTSGIVII